MGIGSSKPKYVVRASRTECSYNSEKGAWTCNSLRLNTKNNNNNAKNTNKKKKKTTTKKK